MSYKMYKICGIAIVILIASSIIIKYQNYTKKHDRQEELECLIRCAVNVYVCEYSVGSWVVCDVWRQGDGRNLMHQKVSLRRDPRRDDAWPGLKIIVIETRGEGDCAYAEIPILNGKLVSYGVSVDSFRASLEVKRG